MPAERLSMRKVREVLRLKHTLGMSLRQISEATGVGKTVIGEYLRRAGVIGITWPVPEAMDDAELERRLFPAPGETGAPACVDRLAPCARGEAYEQTGVRVDFNCCRFAFAFLGRPLGRGRCGDRELWRSAA
jgi:hypothetical protein